MSAHRIQSFKIINNQPCPTTTTGNSIFHYRLILFSVFPVTETTTTTTTAAGKSSAVPWYCNRHDTWMVFLLALLIIIEITTILL
jgi:hypothetical protein